MKNRKVDRRSIESKVEKRSTLLPDAAARGLPRCWEQWDETLAGFMEGLLTMAVVEEAVTGGHSKHAVDGWGPHGQETPTCEAVKAGTVPPKSMEGFGGS